MTTRMHRFWATEYRLDIARAIAAVVLAVVMAIAGGGLKSLLVLAAGTFWIAMSRVHRRHAARAKRHHELRERRLQRMRGGTWSGPDRNERL